ncbi:peptidase M48, Ste24p [Catenovulum agarivorans DS-2]|uniref:Peptidase M48, Ste24p n=1 Tax=Catenovulum agarivorans DS-2 TaxID=1328313 RepID=W7QPR6_9ALTE|nr:M48 family metallopeptidase [Catenovulum agarivorans]EWH09883.1 peptidase M48, Ste24p [Catenovulum agarivorans DS-2]
MKFVRLLSLCLITTVLFSCAKSPTGRSQFIMFDADKMSKMGIDSFEAIKQEQKISTDKQTNQYVDCVADAIIRVLPSDWQHGWEVVVFESEQVNAFALPGRKIGVYTGILGVAENADQLAAIMGHEVGHVIANHGGERVSQNTAANVVLQGAAVMTQGSEYQQATMSVLGLGAQYGVLLPYSRTHESEADVIGLKYMIEAGFKPEASMKLWENMNKLGGNKPMEILSTHPAPETRIDNLAEHIQKFRSNGVKPLHARPSC